MRSWATFSAMLRILSPEDFCEAPTNIGTIAANTMPAMIMVTSSSTKLKPASRQQVRQEYLFMFPPPT